MRLECSKIMYVEYLNHMIVVNMEDESIYNSITMRNNFDEIVKPLTKLPFFIKPHKAFLLNMNYVICLQGRDFTLKNSTLIPISRNKDVYKRQADSHPATSASARTGSFQTFIFFLHQLFIQPLKQHLYFGKPVSRFHLLPFPFR